MLLVRPALLVVTDSLPQYAGAIRKRLSMNSKSSFAVNQLSETAYGSVRGPDNGWDDKLIRTNNMKLEAFAMRMAWAFASIVVLLVIVSLLLVVAGYAGSRLPLH
jgi:hypothetical protein